MVKTNSLLGKPRPKLTFIDLFSGVGGFSLGFKEAGFEHLFGLDNWNHACDVYRKNIGECKEMNIKEFDGKKYKGKVDVLIGSPPCQDFSHANYQARNSKKGMVLVNEFMRVVKEIEPKIWIWENVKNVEKHINKITQRVHIFNSNDYGVFQHRKRCFVSNIILKPEKEHKEFLTKEQMKRVLHFNFVWHKQHFYKPIYTITANFRKGNSNPYVIENKQLRCFTISELKMIMSFPFTFNLCNKPESVCYTLLGNAVPPLLSYRIAEQLKKSLEGEKVE